MPVHSVLNYTLQAALSLADIAELKSFCGVHGLLRYMGPQNGGLSADTQAAYAVLLKLILKSASLRWFFDTYLTAANVAALLGSEGPEFQQIKTEWYGYRLLGCNQGNSSFPILVWMKKQAYWKDEELDNGMFKTMADSMTMKPVMVEEPQETPRGPQTRQKVPIDLHCTTNGCEFICKLPKALKFHEKSCRPIIVAPPAELFTCRKNGCEYVAKTKASLTLHMKSCSPVAPPVTTLQKTKVFACPHQGCRMQHATRKESSTHQRTHKAPEDQKETNDKNKIGRTASRKDGAESVADMRPDKPQLEARTSAAANVFKCPFPGCGKSHATADLAQRHQRSHSEAPPFASTNVFQCPFPGCGKSHATADRAQRHQRSHSEAPPSASTNVFQCPFPGCVKSHATSARALCHQQKHCAPTPSRQDTSSAIYLCPVCPESHASLDLARQHQQKT